MVMEHVDGDPLHDLLLARGRLSERLARKIVFRLVGALAYTASLGLAHRDVKLDNIIWNDAVQV